MKLVRKIFFNRYISKILVKPILNLDSIIYRLIKIISQEANDGIHPKQDIIKYKEWFFNNIQEGSTVLDIGTNTGRVPKKLSKKTRKVYGIEIDSKFLEIAKMQNPADNIEYICADATTFDYKDLEPIDYVTLSNVLEHIENRVSFIKKLMENIKWKDKKRFLIRVPMVDRDWVAVHKKNLGLDYRLDKTHFTEYTLESFGKEIEEIGGLKIKSHSVKFGELYAICESD